MPEESHALQTLARVARHAAPVIQVAGTRALHQLLGHGTRDYIKGAAPELGPILDRPDLMGDLWIPEKRQTLRLIASAPRRDSLLQELRGTPSDDLIRAFAEAAASGLGRDRTDARSRRQAGEAAVRTTLDKSAGFVPDVVALFQIYLALFEDATRERLGWLAKLKPRGARGAPIVMPPSIPPHMGALTTSWQLAWTAARRPIREIVQELEPYLSGGPGKVHWAVNQFIEEAARFSRDKGPPGIVAAAGSDVGGSVSSGRARHRFVPHDPAAPAPLPVPQPPVPPKATDRPSSAPSASERRPRKVTIDLTHVEYERDPGLERNRAKPSPSAGQEAGDRTDLPTVDTPASNTAATHERFPEARDSSARNGDDTSPDAPRFADVLFRQDKAGSAAEALSDHTVLDGRKWYWLEVAVRQEPVGLRSDQPREPIRRFRQRKSANLLVTARSEDFEFGTDQAVIELPPHGDSTLDALFRVRHRHGRPKDPVEAKIEIRIFHRFNLLEYLEVTTQVGANESEAPERVARQSQPAIHRSYVELDEFQPRMMNIHVTGSEGGYGLEFTLATDPGSEAIRISTRRSLDKAFFDDRLAELRGLLERLAVEVYLDRLEGSTSEFREALRNLAGFGSRLWTDLFGGAADSSIDALGRALRERPISTGGLIQVSTADLHDPFIFPWAFLYDRELPEKPYETPDPAGFWGYRYPIEQHIRAAPERLDAPVVYDKQLSLAYMLWQEFGNAADHTSFLLELGKRSGGRMSVSTPPITGRDSFYRQIDDAADPILYFYAHGHSRERRTTAWQWTPADLATALRAPYQDRPDKLKQLDELMDLRALTAGEPDKTFIQLSHGRIFHHDLNQRVRRLAARPFVFLNLCESAQITPFLEESFITLFLDKRARSVLGTECVMTTAFAHPFSAVFLERLLHADSVADALMHARRHFLDRKNPLGLAYTLYGSGTLRFVPACISPPRPEPSPKLTP